MHHAFQNPHLPNDSVEVLLHNGADIDIPNLHGQTTLMGVLRDLYYDYHSNIKSHAQLLLSCGADPNAKDRRGWTCFHYAAQRGCISAMELLLRAKADCDMSSHVGETPLWLLLVCGWREACEYLIRSGCDVNRPASSHIILNINQNVDICRYGDIRPLEFTLCNRYYHIAKLIVLSNGHINEDTWLGSQGSSISSEHLEFMAFLRHHHQKKKNVKTLLECCRDSLRQNIKQGLVVKLQSVVLPQTLKDFLSLSDIS
jgi:ankyrin repeat protein